MTKTMFAVIAAAMLIATPAMADDDDRDCRSAGAIMDQNQIRAQLTEQGYEVRKLEMDDGCYEVHAMDANGQRVEMDIDPVSGQTRKFEYD